MIAFFIGFTIALFILVAAYHQAGDVQIALIKGMLFGFSYDVLYIEDEDVSVCTFQAGVGFILLNLTFEKDGKQ